MADRMNPNFTEPGADPDGERPPTSGDQGGWSGPEPESPGDPDPHHGVPTGSDQDEPSGNPDMPDPGTPDPTGGPYTPHPQPHRPGFDPDTDGE